MSSNISVLWSIHLTFLSLDFFSSYSCNLQPLEYSTSRLQTLHSVYASKKYNKIIINYIMYNCFWYITLHCTCCYTVHYARRNLTTCNWLTILLMANWRTTCDYIFYNLQYLFLNPYIGFPITDVAQQKFHDTY